MMLFMFCVFIPNLGVDVALLLVVVVIVAIVVAAVGKGCLLLTSLPF